MYPDPSFYNWSNYTILIVEDDVSSTFYLKEVLKDTGVNICHAPDGERAIDICKSDEPIHLILMDIRMPGMNGYEAARIIRMMRPDIPIIAQTANAFYETRALCEEAGCIGFLTKPTDSVELLRVISDFLN